MKLNFLICLNRKADFDLRTFHKISIWYDHILEQLVVFCCEIQSVHSIKSLYLLFGIFGKIYPQTKYSGETCSEIILKKEYLFCAD